LVAEEEVAGSINQGPLLRMVAILLVEAEAEEEDHLMDSLLRVEPT
jgi:hypothetical protein